MKCCDCEKKLSKKSHNPKRCKSCSAKERATRVPMPTMLGRERQDMLGENNHNWNGGTRSYRKYIGEACELCAKEYKLIVHHLDGDRYNNDMNNLQTLCTSCHCRVHNHFRRWK